MDKRAGKPLVSIVTLNYNGKKFLPGLFDSLKNCTYPNLEVIMVDNCSSDDSVAYVRKHYPNVKVHENAENYLYAGGNNEGLKIAAGDYICLINNDVEVDAGFIEPIVKAFETYPQMAAAQPKILALTAPDYLEYAGASGGFLDWFGYPFLRGRILATTEKDVGQYDAPLRLFWASGACIFLRKSILEKTGLLDAAFGLHMEEIDLCWRIQLQKGEIYCLPASKIWHYGGGTLPQQNPKKLYWNFRNNIFLLIKNLSPLNLLLKLPPRIVLDFVALIAEAAKGNPAGSLAIIKAYAWLFANAGLILRHRREVQKNRQTSDKAISRTIYPGSVILEYMLMGHKKYTDLFSHRRLTARNQVMNGDADCKKEKNDHT